MGLLMWLVCGFIAAILMRLFRNNNSDLPEGIPAKVFLFTILTGPISLVMMFWSLAKYGFKKHAN